jgi:hypothetical protein
MGLKGELANSYGKTLYREVPPNLMVNLLQIFVLKMGNIYKLAFDHHFKSNHSTMIRMERDMATNSSHLINSHTSCFVS